MSLRREAEVPDLRPVEEPRTMGERLRAARTARGLSVAQVEHDTRISRHYLEALEDEAFEVLPAPVYARGFMRSYARYLGIDPEEAAAAVPRDLPRPAGLEPLPGLRRTGGSSGFRALPQIDLRMVGGGAVAVLIIALALWLAPGLGGAGDELGGDTANNPAGNVSPTPTGIAAGTDATHPPGTVPPYARNETPNFIGVSRQVAVDVLEAEELNPVVIETANAEVPAGEVFLQSPDPGAPIRPGDTVTLIVAR